MSSHVLLLEIEGNVLKKLQHNSLIQDLSAEMLYINDAQMAIDVIVQRDFDVIVVNFGSDMSGCHEFCHKAHEQTAFFIMFVLLIDEKSVGKTNEINCIHQTLALTCAEKEILAAIGRGIQVSKVVQQDARLASLLSKLDSLPSPPSVYFDLRYELDLPSCNSASITDLISRDQTLAAKILRVANSGFYAMPRTILNLRQAVTLLGTETLLGLVLATHLFDNLPLPGLNLENLWKHARGVALMAREIARESQFNLEHVEASGIAGLLHDLGSLVFLTNHPVEYQTMLKTAKGDEKLLIENEREYFGVDHAELGGIVLLLWGLPDLVVNAVKQHHHQHDIQSTLVSTSPIWAVAIAEWMFNNSVLLTTENNEEILNSCPFECTAEQFKHWKQTFEQLQL